MGTLICQGGKLLPFPYTACEDALWPVGKRPGEEKQGKYFKRMET